MPISMRRQSAKHKRRAEKRRQEKKAREQALSLLKQNKPANNIAVQCNLSRMMVYRIRQAWKSKRNAILSKLLNPVDFYPGRPSTITAQEQSMLVKRAQYAAERGFAFDNDHIKQYMGEIANDGRKTFSRGTPSDDTMRAFRARNRELTFRKAENHSHKYFAGENVEHVQTLVDHLRQLRKDYPDMFKDPGRIWNLDETAVTATYGKRLRVYTSSNSNLGGRRYNIKDNGAHVTAVVIASAAGLTAPPFFVAAGKKVMPRWKCPINVEHKQNLPSSLHWLTCDDWLPQGTKLVTSQKGSMTMKLMPEVVNHFNTFCRQSVSEDKPVLLLFDGHSSRKGEEWISYCQKSNIIVVQLPANTSTFLQPCDSFINKKFKEKTREVRDMLLQTGLFANANIAFKLKLGAAGFRALFPSVVKESFVDTGMWPMQFQFLDNLRKKLDNQSRVHDDAENLGHCPLRQTARTSDSVLYSRIKNILLKEPCPTSGVALIEQTLQENRSVHRVLWETAPLQALIRVMKTRTNVCGAPAAILTNRKALSNITNRASRSVTLSAAQHQFGHASLLEGENSRQKENMVAEECEDDIPLLKLWRLQQSGQNKSKDHSGDESSAAEAMMGLASQRG